MESSQLFLTPRASYTNIVDRRESDHGCSGTGTTVESRSAILYNPRNLAARSLAGLE
jgi:hypothetical protein